MAGPRQCLVQGPTDERFVLDDQDLERPIFLPHA
jgi:hypothetical protein